MATCRRDWTSHRQHVSRLYSAPPRAFLDACEWEVDRATGAGFGPLVTDTTPGCTDSHPQPAVQTVWKYRAWFRADDARVGLPSIELSIIVGGP